MLRKRRSEGNSLTAESFRWTKLWPKKALADAPGCLEFAVGGHLFGASAMYLLRPFGIYGGCLRFSRGRN